MRKFLLTGAILILLSGTCVAQQKKKAASDTTTARKAVTDTSRKGTPVLPLFLESYNRQYQELLYKLNLAKWNLNTRIVEGDTSTAYAARLAGESYASYTGNPQIIDFAKRYVKNVKLNKPIETRQLDYILYMAAENPETVSDTVKMKIALETELVKKLFGFDYRFKGQPVTTNKIDELLKNSTDLNERLEIWKASKEVGVGLKDGVVTMRNLRNSCVKALDYKDYFEYQVSDYGMKSDSMLALCDNMIREIWPLYRELHTWARYTLAKKYKEKVPEYLPAHWLPNRWGQDWSTMVETGGLNVDGFLKEKGSEYIVKQGEAFYMSLGFPALPESFYTNSSLYPVPEGANYRKNNHASAWHMDNDKDVRSLMSIEPNTEWWGTTLHELGHIYYYITYSTPEVPVILRNGANRGFHEAMGSLIGLASLQKPFLEGRGMVSPSVKVDQNQQLLREALDFVVHIPWGAGVMTHYEYELYANGLDSAKLNSKWWELVKKYQGIVPSEERGNMYCDAATKTHIIDDAAQYYDYSISNILLFMFHQHIATNILKQDPHATNYWGSKETGDFLKKLMQTGATVDWREHLKKNLGSDMTAKAMVDYFAPLMEYLKQENKGRKYTLPEKFNN
jgi:peptidyl-dipeptidase A